MMERFDLNILGCGSALPTTKHYLSSQVINLREKLFMIDCGEGTQLQFRAMKLNFNRLNHIFLSHLHGDHCLGLPGLISTMGLLGRSADLHVHAQPDAKKVFGPVLRYFCCKLPYQVSFHPFDPLKNELIFEDRSLKVYTIPLKHRVPTAGFLLEEKPVSARHIIREMIDFYQVPLPQIKAIKDGANFITPDREVVPNHRLTRPGKLPRKYAYCSDTGYSEEIISLIEGIDLLYHEATFREEDLATAQITFHSTAGQAALIAKAAKVKRLLLGHYSARYPDESILLKEAQAIFPETIGSNEKMVIKI